MIEKYIAAIQAYDYKALSELFAVKCRYFDYCPIGTSRQNYHIYGRAGIEMFFRNKLGFRVMTLTDPVIESENSANFLMCYSGTYLYARATIESYSPDGLIQTLTVAPA